jgi:hypothetical protein
MMDSYLVLNSSRCSEGGAEYSQEMLSSSRVVGDSYESNCIDSEANFSLISEEVLTGSHTSYTGFGHDRNLGPRSKQDIEHQIQTNDKIHDQQQPLDHQLQLHLHQPQEKNGLTTAESIELSSRLRVLRSAQNQRTKQQFYAGVAPTQRNSAKSHAGRFYIRLISLSDTPTPHPDSLF